MATPLIVRAGDSATFIAATDIPSANPNPTIAPPPNPNARLFAGSWQVHSEPSALVLPRASFFETLANPIEVFASEDNKILVSLSIQLDGPLSTILELLATYSFLNPSSSDGGNDVNARFFIRDSIPVPQSLNGIICSSTASAKPGKNAAGALVFRSNFAPGLHLFTLEVEISSTSGVGSIALGGVGENQNQAAFFIQELDA